MLADTQPDRSRDDQGSLKDGDGLRLNDDDGSNRGFRLKDEEAGSKPQGSLAPVLHMRADLPSLSAHSVSYLSSSASSKQVRLEPWAG